MESRDERLKGDRRGQIRLNLWLHSLACMSRIQ